MGPDWHGQGASRQREGVGDPPPLLRPREPLERTGTGCTASRPSLFALREMRAAFQPCTVCCAAWACVMRASPAMRATEATTPPRLGLPYLDVKLATAAAATALHGAGYVALATLDIGHHAQKYSTLLVFTSVTHTSLSLTASLAIIVPTRSPFFEISKSPKSEHVFPSVLSRPH